MISNLDIWRTAWLMVQRHGKAAPAEAERRPDEMFGEKDLAGWTVWLRIGPAVDAILADGPSGASVH